jgi:hypothetical protein
VAVTLSASDPKTCELAFSVVAAPANGTLGGLADSLCAAGSPHADSASMTYTPHAGFSGSDSFTYQASDGTLSSAPAAVTVAVGAPSSIHVGDLDATAASSGGGYWRAAVDVRVHDSAHGAVSGVTVSASWSGGHEGTAGCTTDSAGRCTLTTGSIRNSVRTATLTVVGLQHATPADATQNHDPDGDSDGTRMTVRKP